MCMTTTKMVVAMTGVKLSQPERNRLLDNLYDRADRIRHHSGEWTRGLAFVPRRAPQPERLRFSCLDERVRFAALPAGVRW